MKTMIPAEAQKIGPMYLCMYPSKYSAFCALLWLSGQAKNPVLLRCDNEEEFGQSVACYREHAEAKEEVKRQRRESRKAAYAEPLQRMKDRCQPGALLSTCWGYEQTNVEFYEVVRRDSDSMVTIREIVAHSESEGWAMDKLLPKPGCFIGPELRKRIGAYGITISSCITARPCKAGEVHHSTSYA